MEPIAEPRPRKAVFMALVVPPPDQGWEMALRPSGRRRRLRPLVIVGVSVVVVLVSVVTLLSVWGNGSSRVASTSMGPYVLNSSAPAIALSFPDCALATVHWTVVSGTSANFSVWPPGDLVHSDCVGPAPSNSTCPPDGCPIEGPPVCFEVGVQGSCSFMATQSGYDFFLYPGQNLASLAVSFVVDYS